MGLDNYWVDKEKKQASVEGDFKVCGGMLSGHGNDSFRGKVYDALVENVSGFSLYTDYLDPTIIQFIASRLEEYTFEAAQNNCNSELSEEEFKDLQLMFRAHADAGHGLTSWY